uniref:Uncharacterized protein n=1 Tax=Arundo donax TaxID=35708 RepID=A0A0A9AVC1_ARUDO
MRFPSPAASHHLPAAQAPIPGSSSRIPLPTPADRAVLGDLGKESGFM